MNGMREVVNESQPSYVPTMVFEPRLSGHTLLYTLVINIYDTDDEVTVRPELLPPLELSFISISYHLPTP